jgi:hypothetical protein
MNTLSKVAADAWIPLIALAVWLVVRLAKDDPPVAWVPFFIRPVNRPVWALGLGIVGGVLVQIILAGSVLGALAGGFVAGCMAIAGHEVIVNTIRKGRDIGTPKPPRGPSKSFWDEEETSPPPSPKGRFFPLAIALLVGGCSACLIGVLDHPSREPERRLHRDGGAE